MHFFDHRQIYEDSIQLSFWYLFRLQHSNVQQSVRLSLYFVEEDVSDEQRGERQHLERLVDVVELRKRAFLIMKTSNN